MNLLNAGLTAGGLRLPALTVCLLTLACAVPGQAERFELVFDVPQPRGFSLMQGRLEIAGGAGGRTDGSDRQYEGVVEKVDLRLEEGGKSVLFASSEPMASSVVLTSSRAGDRVTIEAQLAYLTLSGMQMQKVRLEFGLAAGELRGISLDRLATVLPRAGREVTVEATVSNTQAPRRLRRGRGSGPLALRPL
ncbi:MAG: hypothetical protein AAF604_10080 [Acidobacteriota bacterium]